MNVLVDPNPFCFGSTATMRAIVACLPEAHVRVLATGPVLDLCGDLSVELHDVRDSTALERKPELLEWADVYVAISNNTNVEVVGAAGVPLVFVDPLFWMKRRRTPAMDLAAVYLIEQYPGVAEKLEIYPVDGAVLIGPALRTVIRESTSGTVLMANVGGAASPHLRPGQNTDYPQRVVDLVDALATRHEWAPVQVAMGSKAASSTLPRNLAQPSTLPQCDYLALLARASVLLTAPGLNAPLEAFASGIPVVWLPPQNLTQVFHLRAYVEAGLAPRELELGCLLPGFHVDPRQPEGDGTARVLDALSQLDDNTWIGVLRCVEEQLNRLATNSDQHVERQREWLRSLGPNGAPRVADHIRRLVQ